uniref:Uncharacterized protein n=1 Tax=Anguilla anguilla TaxID=7936 RepID=A0A0E9SVP7_ANGAN
MHMCSLHTPCSRNGKNTVSSDYSAHMLPL